MEGFDAFILTSHLVSVDGGQTLGFWAATERGAVLMEYPGERGVFFIEHDAPFSRSSVVRKKLDLKTFSGKRVDGLYFRDQRDLLNSADELKARGIRTYERDVRTAERFLMERFINASVSVDPGDGGVVDGTLVRPRLKPSTYRPNLKIMSLDIETGSDGSLYSVAFHQVDMKGTGEKRLVLMVGGLQDEGDVIFCASQRELLGKLVGVFRDWDPDCLTGWHVVGFDLCFLHEKFRSCGMDFAIGRGGGAPAFFQRGTKTFASLAGRVIIDGPTALRGAFYRFKDFKLETVARELLGRGKDIADDGDKVAEIERRFSEDKLLLARYNLLDCVLVSEIFQKTALMELLVTRSQVSGLLIDKVGFSVAAFDHLFLPRLHRKGFVAGNVNDSHSDAKTSGGYVFEPEPGMHEDVVTLDFKSLYPSIMTTFCIDPYSRMVAADKKGSSKDVVETPVGIRFSKIEHILPAQIRKLLALRSDARRRGDGVLSQAVKILMNSFYGVMGSHSCRFFHADLPTAITATGQWVLKESRKYLESLGYRVLYGDTDSLFVALKHDDLGDPFGSGSRVAGELNVWLEKILADKFGIQSECVIEFEDYYKKIFFSPLRDGQVGAKKKYAGLVGKPGGGSRLHLSGMEFVRGDWTELAKNFQYEMFRQLFDGVGFEGISDFVKDFIDRLRNSEFDRELIYTKRISKELAEYTKNVPPHIRAASLLKKGSSPYRLKEVSYVYTKNGPVPVQLNPDNFDYQHYIDKQIRPLADGVLFAFQKKFKDVVEGDQLSLF